MSAPTKIKPCRECGSLDIAPGKVRKQDWLCRACSYAQSHEWQEQNRERVRARSRAWRAANREHVLARERKWHEKNRGRKRAWDRTYRADHREEQRAYTASVHGVAARLRGKHGLDEPASKYWAAILTNEQTTCAICRVPVWWLRLHKFYKIGGEPRNRRLSLDHITPGVNDGNYRALCFSCNRTRGVAELTDDEVFMKMCHWYRDHFPSRLLRWLPEVLGVRNSVNREWAEARRTA